MKKTHYPGYKRQIRREIIHMASDIFARFGYRKTTMEDIARQLHMVKSSLYYYFSGKDDIFNAVVDCEAKKIRRKLTDILEQNDDPRTRLRKYIVARMQAMKDISQTYSTIFDPNLMHYDFIEKVRRKYDREEHYTIRRILEEGIQRGVFNVQDPSLASTVICKAMKGLEIPLFWRNKDEHEFHHVENLIHLLFYGLVRRSEGG